MLIEEAAYLEGVKVSTVKAIVKVFKLEGRIEKKKIKEKKPEKDLRKIFNRKVVTFSKTLEKKEDAIKNPKKFFTSYTIELETCEAKKIETQQKCQEQIQQAEQKVLEKVQ